MVKALHKLGLQKESKKKGLGDVLIVLYTFLVYVSVPVLAILLPISSVMLFKKKDAKFEAFVCAYAAVFFVGMTIFFSTSIFSSGNSQTDSSSDSQTQ